MKYYMLLNENERNTYEKADPKMRKNLSRKGHRRFNFILSVLKDEKLMRLAKYSDYESLKNLSDKRIEEKVVRRIKLREWRQKNPNYMKDYLREYNKKKYAELDSNWRLKRDVSVGKYETQIRITKKNKKLEQLKEKTKNISKNIIILSKEIEFLNEKMKILSE